MSRYFTSGQAARKLHISSSTLKRWLARNALPIEDRRNYNGWRLFSEEDIQTLQKFKIKLKRDGKKYQTPILQPVSVTKKTGKK